MHLITSTVYVKANGLDDSTQTDEEFSSGFITGNDEIYYHLTHVIRKVIAFILSSIFNIVLVL